MKDHPVFLFTKGTDKLTHSSYRVCHLKQRPNLNKNAHEVGIAI